jgi:hypothetical protein
MSRLAPCSTPQRSCGTHQGQRPAFRQGVVDCRAAWPPMRRLAPAPPGFLPPTGPLPILTTGILPARTTSDRLTATPRNRGSITVASIATDVIPSDSSHATNSIRFSVKASNRRIGVVVNAGSTQTQCSEAPISMPAARSRSFFMLAENAGVLFIELPWWKGEKRRQGHHERDLNSALRGRVTANGRHATKHQ